MAKEGGKNYYSFWGSNITAFPPNEMSIKTLITESVGLPSVRGRAERGRLSAHRLQGAGRHGRWPDRAVLASLASEEAMTGTVLVVEERRGRCGAGGGLQKESRGESRRRGRRGHRCS